MHRAHDPRVETDGREGYHLGRKDLRRKYARRFGTPRSPWEPRLYGRLFWVSNLKLRMFDNGLAGRKSLSNLLYCCAPAGFPASIYRDAAVGDRMCTTAAIPSRGSG